MKFTTKKNDARGMLRHWENDIWDWKMIAATFSPNSIALGSVCKKGGGAREDLKQLEYNAQTLCVLRTDYHRKGFQGGNSIQKIDRI